MIATLAVFASVGEVLIVTLCMLLNDHWTRGRMSKKAELLRFDAMPRPELLGMQNDILKPILTCYGIKRSVRTLDGFTKKYANEEDVAIYLELCSSA